MLAGLKTLFGGIFKLLGKTKFWIPRGFAPVFLILSFFTEGVRLGWGVAVSNLLTRLFSAEYIIQQNVNIAINTPELYTLFIFFEIVNSFFIIYYFIKFFVWIIEKGMISNKGFFQWVLAIFIFVLIEITTITIIGAYDFVPKEFIGISFNMIKFNFIPFKDGILYLILNYDSVLTWNLLKFW